MRNFFILTLLVVFSTVQLKAQDISNFRFGLHISPSLSWMNTDDNGITNQGTALGLKLATQAEFNFAEKYSFASGIGFHFNTGGTMQSQYGGNFFVNSLEQGNPYNNEAEPTGNQVLLDYSIQYIEIPLALKLRTREFGTLTYYLEAPIFTIGIRGNAMGGISGGAISEEFEDISIKKEVNPVAMSWGFGAGIEHSVLDGTSLIAGLTFQRMFTDATRDSDYTYINRSGTNDPKATINSLTLKLGVLF